MRALVSFWNGFCVCVCVCACMRVCVRVCVRMHALVHLEHRFEACCDSGLSLFVYIHTLEEDVKQHFGPCSVAIRVYVCVCVSLCARAHMMSGY